MEKTLNKAIETLKEVKDKLEKDFASFGTAIGGGTTENPTIAPTPATSIKMSENSKEGDWFDKKEKVTRKQLRSTASLSKKEFNDFKIQLQQFAAEMLGIDLPDPNECI